MANISINSNFIIADYEADSAKLIVKYLDQDGQSIAPDKVYSDITFDGTYSIAPIDIAGYQPVDLKPAEGTIMDDHQQVIFKYTADCNFNSNT